MRGSFRFRSGRPALDLTATIVGRYREPVEQLAAPADLALWLAAAGVPRPPRTVTLAELRCARALREAIYRLAHAVLAGEALPARDARVVNAIAAHPPPEPWLGADGGLSWRARDPARAALAFLARDAIDLLTGPLAGRIGECAADDCSVLFVDTSRPGRRRWCAEDVCGNRQHVRAHRRRQRPGRER